MNEINSTSQEAGGEAIGAGRENAAERVIGRYVGSNPGPLVICIGGIHGNEPAGVHALRKVLAELGRARPQFRGMVVGLTGNARAIARGQRYLDRDLNRAWLPENVRNLRIRADRKAECSEEIEQRELLSAIETAILESGAGENPDRPVLVIDLHTTSSQGAPFAIISDTLMNRRLAETLEIPIILGLEESIEGTILNYINEIGFSALGVEAGQHDAPSSIENHEAVIWLLLASIGCIEPASVPGIVSLQQRLSKAAGGLPQFLEVRYRHAISPADEFAMHPGFLNFHRVEKNQAIASDRRGEVRTIESGYLFMPLYQKLGEDGFFLVRGIRPFWMKLSALMRRARFDRALPLLPGVHRLAGTKDSLVIDRRIAHWFVLEICHLLGFRKHYQTTELLIVSRRRQQEV